MNATESISSPADLETLREKKGETQFTIAVKSGLSLATVQRFETGKATSLSPRTRAKLADGYGVSIDEINRAVGAPVTAPDQGNGGDTDEVADHKAGNLPHPLPPVSGANATGAR